MPDPAGDRDGERRGDAGRGATGDGPRAGSLSERRWSVVAAACLVAAAALWVLVGVDAAFVVATFGVVAWFWDQRNRIERRGIEGGWWRESEDDGGEDFADESEAETGDESENDDERPRGVGK